MIPEMTDIAPAAADAGLAHLDGPSSEIRQVLAAHFVRDCAHVVELGGHLRPVTRYLTHHPASVLSVDPKTPPFEADELNGRPCRVRHVAKKFQDVDFDYEPRSYGLVLLGYSLKPKGGRSPLDRTLFGLVDNAKVVVIDFPPALARATDQMPSILGRPGLAVHCSIDLRLHDAAIEGSPYRDRRFYVLRPEA